MFAVTQAVICTFYFVVFLSEAVTENGPPPNFLKETHERIRVNRAVKEPSFNKSLNSEDSKKELNSTENTSPILIISLNSEKTKIEDESSSDKELLKEKVTNSTLLITKPEISPKKGHSKEKESLKANLTDSAQTRIQSLKLENKENKEETSTEQKSPKANLTDSAQLIMKSLNISMTNNDEANSTEKESETNSDAKNSSEKDTSILNPEVTNEGGNLTENDSLKANLTDSVQVKMRSTKSKEEKKGNSTEKKIQKGEGNSKEKKLKNENISKASNSENAKIKEGKLTEKEPSLKNLTGVSEKSPAKNAKSKSRRGTNWGDESVSAPEPEDDVTKAFLTAYGKCKLLVGKHFVRIADLNVDQTTDCVMTELKKLESYDKEFTKYLDNEEIVRA